jgi:uncharacterized protein (TIGR02453 family)
MEKVLQFLRDLSENNTREWFDANRDRYQESREKMLFLTELLMNEIRKFDPEIPVADPKDCLFRIHRDVRFSADKRPYKTNFGSFISAGGRKGEYPGYYFHIEPGQSFAGGGMYMPGADALKSIRKYIARFSEELTGIINEPVFKAVYPKLYDHQLKTAPKGFPKDHEYIHLLRYKSYVCATAIDDSMLDDGTFLEKTVEAYRLLNPFNAFLSDALKNNKID